MSANDHTEPARRVKPRRPLVPGQLWRRCEAIAWLGCSDPTFRAWVKDGRIIEYCPGEKGTRYIRTDDLIQLILSNPVQKG